jgi:hypothetical protein
LEESETPSPLPEGSILEAAEVETVPAVEEREFPTAIKEAKAVEVALCGNMDSNFFALDPKLVPKPEV